MKPPKPAGSGPDSTPLASEKVRVPFHAKVDFVVKDFVGFISLYSANISKGGMFITTTTPEKPGTTLDFEFRLTDDYPLICGSGVVVWIRTRDDGPGRPPGMGVRFTHLDEKSHTLVNTIVTNYIQEGGTPFDIDDLPSADDSKTLVLSEVEEKAIANARAPSPYPPATAQASPSPDRRGQAPQPVPPSPAPHKGEPSPPQKGAAVPPSPPVQEPAAHHQPRPAAPQRTPPPAESPLAQAAGSAPEEAGSPSKLVDTDELRSLLESGGFREELPEVQGTGGMQVEAASEEMDLSELEEVELSPAESQESAGVETSADQGAEEDDAPSWFDDEFSVQFKMTPPPVSPPREERKAKEEKEVKKEKPAHEPRPVAAGKSKPGVSASSEPNAPDPFGPEMTSVVDMMASDIERVLSQPTPEEMEAPAAVWAPGRLASAAVAGRRGRRAIHWVTFLFVMALVAAGGYFFEDQVLELVEQYRGSAPLQGPDLVRESEIRDQGVPTLKELLRQDSSNPAIVVEQSNRRLPPLRWVENILWEAEGEETRITLWGSGAFSLSSTGYFRLEEETHREVVKIRGVSRAYWTSEVVLNTPQVDRIRLGYREREPFSDLYVVVDLADASSRLVAVTVDQDRLELRVKRVQQRRRRRS